MHICPTLVLRNSKIIFLIKRTLWVGSPQIEDIICGFTSLKPVAGLIRMENICLFCLSGYFYIDLELDNVETSG